MATPFAVVEDSATIGTAEYSLPADSTTLTAQTDDGNVSCFIDLSAMTAADQFCVRVYETVNGSGQKVVFQAYPTGVQAELYPVGPLMLGVGWNITVQKIAGTDRSIGWSIRRDIGDRNALTIGAAALTATAIAADAITAAKIASDVTTELQTGLATASALATAQADLDDIQTRVPAALVSGRMDSSVGAVATGVIAAASFAASAITSTVLAADAITAAKVAADVTTELQSGLATSAEIATAQADLDNIQTRIPAALVSGRMDSSVGAMAANVLTATAIAADAGVAIAAAVWSATAETAESFGDAIRLMTARLLGKGTVQTGDGSYAFRDKDDSKNRIAGAVTATARTVTTRDGT